MKKKKEILCDKNLGKVICFYLFFFNTFLDSIPQKFNHEKLIFTYDVTNLYNDIPHELGKAILFWIKNTQRPYTQDLINKYYRRYRTNP